MNTQPNEIAAVGAAAAQAIASATGSQLITLDPAAYVAEVFKPFNDTFAILKAEADTITLDASTTAGMEICVKYRAAFRDDVRVAGEKARVERKAPILMIGKLLDSSYAELKNAVIPYEAKFDAAIKAEEKRKDDLKKAEAEREEKVRMRIVAIRDLPLSAVGKTAAAITAMIADLEADAPDESFGKLQDAAITARAEVLVKLTSVHAAAVSSEEEAARIAAERAELAQLREAAAERQRLAAIDAADQRNASAARANVAADATAVESSSRAAALADQGRLADIADQQVAPADDVVDATYTPPTLRLGHINERIAPLAISADGLLSLGFAPAATDKAAKLYHEQDFPRICVAMQRHIDVVRAKYTA